MEKSSVSKKLDWNRLLGFEQVAGERSAIGGRIGGKVGEKVGEKVGTKIGVKLGQKAGIKA